MKTLVVSTDAPIVGGPPQGQWTFEDWENLPHDGNRYEVIDGILYMTPARHSFHLWTLQRIDRLLGIPVEDQGFGRAFSNQIGGVLMDGCTPVQPDYVVLLNANNHLVRYGWIVGAPDIIIEICPSATAIYDEQIKLRAYARSLVPEYAVIDTDANVVRLYKLQAPGRYAAPRVYNEGDLFSFSALPHIRVPVSEIFTGTPDTFLE